MRQPTNVVEATRVWLSSEYFPKNFDSKAYAPIPVVCCGPPPSWTTFWPGRKHSARILLGELDARHDNQVLEDRLNLRTTSPAPPTSQFREMNCPPRDILFQLANNRRGERSGSRLVKRRRALTLKSLNNTAAHFKLEGILELFLPKYSIKI